MDTLLLNHEACWQDFQESLALARKWQTISRGKIALRELGVNLWEAPSHTIGTSIKLQSVSADCDVLVYDGGAISEDGLFVVKIPFIKDVINNKETTDEFLKAKIASGTSEYLLSLVPMEKLVSPIEIFKLCINGYWKTDMFYAISDKKRSY